MAASLEHQLVSKILELRDFHTAEKLKITEEFFFSPEAREIFRYIRNHFHNPQTFNSVPSTELVMQIFGGFYPSQSSDSLPTLCDQVRLAKMRVELISATDQVAERAEANPREAMDMLREAVAVLSTKHDHSNDLLLSDAYEVLREEYETVANNQGVTGLPWAWGPINEATQGIHQGEFILIYGRMKNMKTWFALYTMVIINMYANARTLIYSLEMKPRQIARRVAAIRSGIDYKKLIAGQLQPADRDAYFNTLWQLKQAKEVRDPTEIRTNDLLIVDGKRSGISFLHSKIREFQPDIILVDGCYLMQDDRQGKRTVDWKAVAHISQDLKATAMDFDIPVVGTAQANRKADRDAKNADLSEVSYSDAFGQDTDFSIRVQKRIDKSTGHPELVLAFPGSRETDLEAILINGIPATDFTLKSERVSPTDTGVDDDAKDKSTHNGTAHAAAPKLPIFGGRLSGDKAL